ncbi:MAG: SGNH/GDSL hydrolase family protein [Limisphaerales bacterium]
MNRGAALLFLWQALSMGCAVVMGVWIGMPWPGNAALGVLGAGVMAANLAASVRRGAAGKAGFLLASVCTLAIPTSLLPARQHIASLSDTYYSVMAWLVAGAIFPMGFRFAPSPLRTGWKALGMAWAACGALLWLVDSYSLNAAGAFYAGLLLNVAWLILCKLWFRLPRFGILLINTLIVIAIGLPAADLFMRPAYRLNARPGTGRNYYSYGSAKKDPAAFAHWWRYYLDQWDSFMRGVAAGPRQGPLPFRLRPGSEGTLFESRIRINSMGFRGREISRDKGRAYRIVALGESTTFGVTLGPADKPWPELLEGMIQERLAFPRPVEIINAGVPAYGLAQNVYRLQTEILALKPDMIISYHGFNGFRLLDGALPAVSGKAPPRYRQRPLKLLADCEYRLKVMRDRGRRSRGLTFHQPGVSQVMSSKYARLYGELIEIARTNGVRLVLANFSMAVNPRSDPDVIGFYQGTFPSVYGLMRANLAHSLMVAELARQHPEVCLADTHPGLDGAHEKFIDLAHLTQEGRRQLAENIFAVVKKVLGSPGESEQGGHRAPGPQ